MEAAGQGTKGEEESAGTEVWRLSPRENGAVNKREEGADMFTADKFTVEFVVPLGPPGRDVLWATR